jgi:hypothetical protein
MRSRFAGALTVRALCLRWKVFLLNILLFLAPSLSYFAIPGSRPPRNGWRQLSWKIRTRDCFIAVKCATLEPHLTVTCSSNNCCLSHDAVFFLILTMLGFFSYLSLVTYHAAAARGAAFRLAPPPPAQSPPYWSNRWRIQYCCPGRDFNNCSTFYRS